VIDVNVKGKTVIYFKRRFTGYAFCVCIMLLLQACEFNINTLEVEWCTPANGAVGVNKETDVEVQFSSDVNHSDVEEMFILECAEKRISGKFSWVSGKRFVFTPDTVLEKNGRYMITLLREIRDKEGNTMAYSFLSDFYIGDDFVNPEIVSSYPQYNSGTTLDVAIDRDIIIDFSRSMNRQKTQAAFSISPEVAGYFVWSESTPALADSRLEYRLTEKMDYGRVYRLKVNEYAEDSTGNRTGYEYCVNFLTGNDTVPPAIDVIEYNDCVPGTDNVIYPGTVRHGVSRRGPITIRFTEPMNRQSVEKAVTIRPSAQGTFDWHSDSRVDFIPFESFEPETLYSFSIDASCRDINGLHMRSAYAVQFKTDALDSLFVRIGKVSGSYNNSVYTDLRRSWPASIEMGPADNTSYYIRIEFMSSIDPELPARMEKYSVFDNIIIETFQAADGNTNDLHSPAVISDISWLAGSDNTVIIKIGGMTNRAISPSALYRMTLAGGKSGVVDRSGNYMKEDFVIEFREVQ